MLCLKPVKIGLSDEQRAERYEKTWMALEYRIATSVYVPCGKCEACLTNRRAQWTFRLKQELKNSESCYFVTLTYDDSKLRWEFVNISGTLSPVPVVCKRDVQLFLKRLREKISPFKIRYYLVSEYGPRNLRPHYHMILFNFPNLLKNKLDEFLSDSWSNGFIRVDPISDARLHYVTGYCLDGSQIPSYLPKNFMLCSRRPALGSSFLDVPGVLDYCSGNVTDMWAFTSSSGEVNHVKMPRYYRDRLFDDVLNDKISNKNNEYHREKYDRLRRKQAEWLVRNGIKLDERSLKCPYPGSPLDLQRQQKETFKEKVRKNFKNKKNGKL